MPAMSAFFDASFGAPDLMPAFPATSAPRSPQLGAMDALEVPWRTE